MKKSGDVLGMVAVGWSFSSEWIAAIRPRWVVGVEMRVLKAEWRSAEAVGVGGICGLVGGL